MPRATASVFHDRPVSCVVALACEARPLCERYGLEARGGDERFRVYVGLGLRLILSGVGKTAAAAATGYLTACAADGQADAWLNLGTAGHAELRVGAAVLASEVVDGATGQRFDTWTPDPSPCCIATVVTADRPVTEYSGEAVYDMEASGFCATVRRRRPSAAVACLKIVSDNRNQPARRLGAARVAELVRRRIELVDAVIRRLQVRS